MPALGLDFERSLNVTPAAARQAIADALRQAGFHLTAEQLTRIEAKRGSKWLGGSMMPDRMLPVVASFDVAPSGDGCVVGGHLGDEHLNLGGKAWGWNQTYRRLFCDVQAVVDQALARLDPAAAPSFAEPRFWTKGGEIPLLEQAQDVGARAGATVSRKAGEVLEGGSRDQLPAAWKGVDSVTFTSAMGTAVLSLTETQAHLGVAMMVTHEPGAMPANLALDVERLAARIEQALTLSPGQAVSISIEDSERPVLEFMNQQVRIRDGLPVRTLHRCRTCNFEKLTNEDFARIQLRNQRLRGLVGGIGATITSSTVQPFVILGQLFRLKKLDPDYVCTRCQGLEADERVVTFCPACGQMRPEAVLRLCRKCGYDFRSRLTGQALWQAPKAVPEMPPAPSLPGTNLAGRVPAAGDPSPAVAAGRTSCPACGQRLAETFSFCPRCGARL